MLGEAYTMTIVVKARRPTPTPHLRFTSQSHMVRIRWLGPLPSTSPPPHNLSSILPSLCVLIRVGMADLSRLAPVYPVVKTEGQSFNKGTHTASQPGLSLPSFATFRDHASRSDDASVDGPEIANTMSRLPCFSCSKLKPMVYDIAVAAAELDEHVQSHFNKAVVRVGSTSDGRVRHSTCDGTLTCDTEAGRPI